MDITDTELKEKLVKTYNLMVATEYELLAVIKVPYTENTFQNWCKTVCDATPPNSPNEYNANDQALKRNNVGRKKVRRDRARA